MSGYVPRPYESFDGDISVKLDLCNYTTYADLKGQQEKIHLI